MRHVTSEFFTFAKIYNGIFFDNGFRCNTLLWLCIILSHSSLKGIAHQKCYPFTAHQALVTFSPNANTVEAHGGYGLKFKKNPISLTWLHTACVVPAKCLEDPAVQFVLRWWCKHHVLSQNIHCSEEPHSCELSSPWWIPVACKLTDSREPHECDSLPWG